jgi:hypothetical protein
MVHMMKKRERERERERENQEPGIVVHACNPSTQEARMGVSIQGQPELNGDGGGGGEPWVQSPVLQKNVKMRFTPKLYC